MNADEMFEELGYKKKVNHTTGFECEAYIKSGYVEGHEPVICFDYLLHSVNVKASHHKVLGQNSSGDNLYQMPIRSITMQELQAINEKCKELDWI